MKPLNSDIQIGKNFGKKRHKNLLESENTDSVVHKQDNDSDTRNNNSDNQCKPQDNQSVLIQNVLR